MTTIIDKLKAEPVMAGKLFLALVVAGAAFGFSLSPEQVGAILGVLAVVGLAERSQVSPVGTLEGDTPPQPPDGVAGPIPMPSTRVLTPEERSATIREVMGTAADVMHPVDLPSGLPPKD